MPILWHLQLTQPTPFLNRQVFGAHLSHKAPTTFGRHLQAPTGLQVHRLPRHVEGTVPFKLHLQATIAIVAIQSNSIKSTIRLSFCLYSERNELRNLKKKPRSDK